MKDADGRVKLPPLDNHGMGTVFEELNRDFLEYVKLVKQFYQTGEARPADWDVPELDD